MGSGKSSLLEALLGETLPVQAPGKAAAGPVLCGSVAYCSQVPWIVSGSVRVRTLVQRLHMLPCTVVLCF